jgi:hypothetical protein
MYNYRYVHRWVRHNMGAPHLGAATAGCDYKGARLQLGAATTGAYAARDFKLCADTLGCGYLCTGYMGCNFFYS